MDYSALFIQQKRMIMKRLLRIRGNKTYRSESEGIKHTDQNPRKGRELIESSFESFSSGLFVRLESSVLSSSSLRGSVIKAFQEKKSVELTPLSQAFSHERLVTNVIHVKKYLILGQRKP